MVLVTKQRSWYKVVCVCKDGATALDYLHTIATKPLRANNQKFGSAQSWRYEGEKNWEDCENNPCDWVYIVDNEQYNIEPVDYID